MTTDPILVLAASGKTGRRVAARLRVRGVPVRAASRSSAVPFDWSDPTGWDAALTGAVAVYAVAPPQPGPMHDFVVRAHAAGARRVVLLSGRGADDYGDSTFGLDMRDAEDAVRNSDMEWTILRPNNFDQNFDEDLFQAPLTAGTLALPAGPVGEPFIDVEDVADVAAETLLRPDGHAGRVYELSGPRALSFAEATELIGRAADRRLTYEEIGSDDYVAALVAGGVSADDARHVADMFALMRDGLIAAPADGVQTVLGRPPTPFEDYVVRAAARGAWRR